MNETKSMSGKLLAGIIGILVLIGALVAWAMIGNKEPAKTGENTASTTPNETVAQSKKYTNGTYSAEGSYVSPAGAEHVVITLTIADDVITDAKFEGKATNPTSKMMQARFSQGYTAQVVGKAVDQVSLSVVNGSSLAPHGFMDALQKIKTQAQVAA